VQLDLYTQIILSVLSVYQSANKGIYKFLISDTRHPGTLQLREQECQDRGGFSVPKWGSRSKSFGKHWARC
jgi:hypothetical protein